MMPSFASILRSAAESLSSVIEENPRLAPRIRIVVAALQMVSADVDTHVAECLRWAENIRRILERAREIVPPNTRMEIDRALALKLEKPEDYTVPNVDAHLVALKQALIATQTALEDRKHPGSTSLIDDIWTLLEDYVTRRGRVVPPMW